MSEDPTHASRLSTGDCITRWNGRYFLYTSHVDDRIDWGTRLAVSCPERATPATAGAAAAAGRRARRHSTRPCRPARVARRLPDAYRATHARPGPPDGPPP